MHEHARVNANTSAHTCKHKRTHMQNTSAHTYKTHEQIYAHIENTRSTRNTRASTPNTRAHMRNTRTRMQNTRETHAKHARAQAKHAHTCNGREGKGGEVDLNAISSLSDPAEQ